MGVAAAGPSKLIPHSTTFSGRVADDAICNIVLIAVPVVTFTSAAVVGMAPLAAKYSVAMLASQECLTVMVDCNESPVLSANPVNDACTYRVLFAVAVPGGLPVVTASAFDWDTAADPFWPREIVTDVVPVPAVTCITSVRHWM